MTTDDHRILVLAHRGDAAGVTENTLAAFAGAAESGADGVELDIHETSDGLFAVHHDPRIRGLSLAESPLEELRLRAGGCGPEGLALLDDALDLLADAGLAEVFVEIKGLRDAGNLAARLEPWRDRLRLNIQSFDHDLLRMFAGAASGRYSLGLIADEPGSDPRALLESLDADVLSLRRSSLTADLAPLLHAAGKRLAVWTVNDPGRIREVAAMGVDAVISDRPGLAVETLAALGF